MIRQPSILLEYVTGSFYPHAGATFLPAKDAKDAQKAMSDIVSGGLNATEALARGFGLKSHVEQRADKEAALVVSRACFLYERERPPIPLLSWMHAPWGSVTVFRWYINLWRPTYHRFMSSKVRWYCEVRMCTCSRMHLQKQHGACLKVRIPVTA